MNLKKAGIVVFVLLLIDQISKIYIKTHFQLGEAIDVFSWFKILFIENEGMAWGAKIPGAYGKEILTIFRVVAIVAIGFWLRNSIKERAPQVLIWSVTLILAGAIGNTVDSLFYGLVFDDSYGQVAHLFAEDNYGTFLKGKVVDMLYFPLFDGILPSWIPIWGGERFVFFEPVFNFADTVISIGFGMLIVFNKKAFPKEDKK